MLSHRNRRDNEGCDRQEHHRLLALNRGAHTGPRQLPQCGEGNLLHSVVGEDNRGAVPGRPSVSLAIDMQSQPGCRHAARSRRWNCMIALAIGLASGSVGAQDQSHPSDVPWYRRSLVGMEVGPTDANFGRVTDVEDMRASANFDGREIVAAAVSPPIVNMSCCGLAMVIGPTTI